MKALASEITRKLGKRLKWLNIIVKELTGAFSLKSIKPAFSDVVHTPTSRRYAADKG